MLSFTDLLQTSKMKIFLTPYYSSSSDETILLYESFKISRGRENEWKKWKRSLQSSKVDFHEIFRNDHFFELRPATFVRIFNLDKVCKLQRAVNRQPGFRPGGLVEQDVEKLRPRVANQYKHDCKIKDSGDLTAARVQSKIDTRSIKRRESKPNPN